jgi:hypothetical protein
MTGTTQLKLASIVFAVLWTSFVGWTSRPLHTGELVILLVCGALAGLGWYFGVGRWQRYQSNAPIK